MTDTDSDFSSIAPTFRPPATRSDGQTSIRSRTSRFVRNPNSNPITNSNSIISKHQRTRSILNDKEKVTKSIFQWNGGGSHIFITGSWDLFKNKLPMESVSPGFYRIILPIPSTDRAEYFFYVDGQKQVAPDLPSLVNEHGDHVNVKHADATVTQKAGRVTKIISKISGLDLYSPFQRQKLASMIVFRLFYLLTFPAAAYYFYWLTVKGGNLDHPFIWLTFTIAEIMSLASAVIGLFSMWSPVRRKWRSLDSLKPPLPSEDWPTVDIVIAHYKENPGEMRHAIRCALNLDYPAHLLHIIIADDGYFAAPKVVERTELGVDMYQILAEEAGYDPLIDEVMHENGLVEHYIVKSGEDQINRMDCALECHHFDFGPFTEEEKRAPGVLPRLSLIARVKPESHHNKAGNINNVLFNADTNGKIILFLDADMQISENFLLRTLPLMLEELSHDAADHVLPEDLVDPEVGVRNGNNSWRINRDVAFVQAPQRFHNVDSEDYMAHRNAVFYDGICAGRDGFGLTPFVGTNACWRREVLREINGFVYGSVTEDTLTSNEVHNRGYVSKYAAEDLAWGEAPVSVAAAMLQRQRWAKGAVMNGMKIINALWNNEKDKRYTRRRGEIDEYYEYRRTARRPNNGFVRAMFALDSTLYPFLGVSAYLYIITSVAYLATAQSPISPTSIGELASAFVLYYCIRYIAFYSAFAGVSPVDILRSQQTWFSYNVCHVMGVFDALSVNGRMGWVANTGERNRRHWMEWVNVFLCFLLSGMIVFRLVAFLTEGGCAPWNSIGSIFFGLFILVNMYPMASISLNERLSSATDEEKEHKPLLFPLPHAISIGTIIGVAYLAIWAKTPCGLKSDGLN